MRLVLDTDVLVAAFRSDQGASRQLLLAAFEGRVEMLVSVPLVLEYEAVLTRPQMLRDMAMTIGEVGAVIDAILTTAVPVEMRFLWRPQLKDPSDEMVLETAVNGNADYLATFNLRHLREAAGLFGVRAAVPGQIWRKIRSEYEKE
ncbi:MAG: putative toxin-antitoxin system toxin component, PIN family [Bryobacteraceae bacterium]|jgi:putative PIN family toxin of toxin-antitoxin system